MIVVSDALPIQFWPIGEPTFNESIHPFVDTRPYYHKWATSDTLKFQISNETNSGNSYALKIVDINGNQIGYFDFVRSTVAGKYCFDLEFTWASLGLPDQSARFYIVFNNGTLDDQTLDSQTLDTFGDGDIIYKSDYHIFLTTVTLNQAYGTKVIFYNSTKNFAGIKYPNNSHYFQLRVPCRFYKPRNVKASSQLALSQSNIVTTSIVSTSQKLFETVLMPQYMLDKLELIFQHCVAGSVIIDGVTWQADESFDRADLDHRCSFDWASTWLSKGVTRNII